MKNKIEFQINSPLFGDEKKKAVITILFLSNLLRGDISEITKKFDLTIQQYNVLRVLRVGHNGSKKMKMSDVKERMVFKDSDISRLLGRISKKGLIDCYSDNKDQRIRWCLINEKGLKLLSEMDKDEDQFFKAARLLTVEEARQMNLLFDKVLQVYPL